MITCTSEEDDDNADDAGDVLFREAAHALVAGLSFEMLLLLPLLKVVE